MARDDAGLPRPAARLGSTLGSTGPDGRVGTGAPAPGPATALLTAHAVEITSSAAAVLDVLILIAYPWFAVTAFHSLAYLTMKAAFASGAVAALAAGEELARVIHPLQGRPSVLVGRVRTILAALALWLALSVLAMSWAVSQQPSAVALTAILGAFGAGLLLGLVRPAPRRSFPFAPRMSAIASLRAMDRSAFAAVLATLLLTWTGPTAALLPGVALALGLAVLGRREGLLPEAVRAEESIVRSSSLPRVLLRAADRLHDIVGDQGLLRSRAVADATALAFQVLLGVAVYKIIVHMEFTTLALGLLVASAAVGELVASRSLGYVSDRRLAAIGILVGGLFAIGMFAGIAGSAFPPLEFVFWAGAAFAAAFVDGCRVRVHLGSGASDPVRWASAYDVPSTFLGPARIPVMVWAGYMVWWVSTWLAKPHSINLVLTAAGVSIGFALVWAVLPAAVGQGALTGTPPSPHP